MSAVTNNNSPAMPLMIPLRREGVLFVPVPACVKRGGNSRSLKPCKECGLVEGLRIATENRWEGENGDTTRTCSL